MVGLAHEDHVIGRVGAALGKRHDMMDLVAFGHAVEALDGEEGVAGADVAHDVFRGDVGRAVDLPVLDQAVEFLTVAREDAVLNRQIRRREARCKRTARTVGIGKSVDVHV